MADRAVYKTGKDRDGDITSLCGQGTEAWSPRRKSDAIADINSGSHRYYVPWQGGSTWIEVVQGSMGPYLRTNRDGTSKNNLDDLPNC